MEAELSESLAAMGDLLLAQGDHIQAADHYRRALDLMEKVLKRPAEEAERLNTVAWFLAACPDPQFRAPARAVDLSRKAMRLSPDNGNFWNTLGLAPYR